MSCIIFYLYIVVNNNNFRSFLKPQIEFKTYKSLYFDGKEMIKEAKRIQGRTGAKETGTDKLTDKEYIAIYSRFLIN